MDILGYLRSKNLDIKDENNKNVHVACFYCNEDPSERGRLYINVDPTAEIPGLHTCFLCGEGGSFFKIKKHFGDSLNSQEVVSDRTYKLLGAAAKYYSDVLWRTPEAVDFVVSRGFSRETAEKFQLGWADGGLKKHLLGEGFKLDEIKATNLVNDMGDFFVNRIIIPYKVKGLVVQLRGRAIRGEKEKYKTPSGDQARLFNSDSAWFAENVIITEGEFDAISLEQLGFNAVACPGSNTWKDVWANYFPDAKKVYVCFDNDDAGNKGRTKIQKSIGFKTRLVTMPAMDSGIKMDPNELMANFNWDAAKFQSLLNKATGGLLISVEEALNEWESLQGVDGLKLGFETIDKNIAPGLMPGQLMIYNAKTNSGKTICMLNIFHNMAMCQPDKKILFVSLEQTRAEWFERARRIYRFYNLGASDYDAVDFWAPRLYLTDKNRMTEDELAAAIDEFEFEMGTKPDLVAIDYLGYWARAFKGEPYERASSAVMALKAMAKDLRVPIITPHQMNRSAEFGKQASIDQGRDSGVIEETGDFVFTLWAEDQQLQDVHRKTGTVNMQIGKSRQGSTGWTQKLQFAPISLAMVPRGDKLEIARASNPNVERAYREIEMNRLGWDFERVIKEHASRKPVETF